MATGASASIREEFPALDQSVHGRRLTYLDNAATTQRPRRVIEAVRAFYEHDNANVHRGVHELSRRATDAFEEARRRVQRFVGARSDAEIIFTKGCTEAINLVAASWGRANLRHGDVVLAGNGEHHANIVPWQLVAEQVGAQVRPIPLLDSGDLDLDQLRSMLDGSVKMVAVKHVCNALGTINPVETVIEMAHAVGALTMIDGAQALAHEKVDVMALDVDFYAMSGHKVYGPTGIGALYGKRELLEAMPPYQGGGDMIRTVSFEGTTFNELPNKFEAGTPHISGAIGLGEALEFVREVGLDAIASREHQLTAYATSELGEIDALTLVGNPKRKAGILSFTMAYAHPHDIGTILDREGVAIRTGHHCCMPLMKRLGLAATARASLAVYSDEADVEALVLALRKVQEVLG